MVSRGCPQVIPAMFEMLEAMMVLKMNFEVWEASGNSKDYSLILILLRFWFEFEVDMIKVVLKMISVSKVCSVLEGIQMNDVSILKIYS